jgi:hypothetical protein
MKRAVWKFSKPLNELQDLISFSMPAGSKVLSVANQDENLCVYVLVDPESTNVQRPFRVTGTGHPVEGSLGVKSFVGTVLFRDGTFVLHVFEME